MEAAKMHAWRQQPNKPSRKCKMIDAVFLSFASVIQKNFSNRPQGTGGNQSRNWSRRTLWMGPEERSFVALFLLRLRRHRELTSSQARRFLPGQDCGRYRESLWGHDSTQTLKKIQNVMEPALLLFFIRVGNRLLQEQDQKVFEKRTETRNNH